MRLYTIATSCRKEIDSAIMVVTIAYYTASLSRHEAREKIMSRFLKEYSAEDGWTNHSIGNGALVGPDAIKAVSDYIDQVGAERYLAEPV